MALSTNGELRCDTHMQAAGGGTKYDVRYWRRKWVFIVSRVLLWRECFQCWGVWTPDTIKGE